jgi:hypothetical protein
MKLLTTEPGRDMCGGAGAAVGIGMEENYGFAAGRKRVLCPSCVSRHIVDEAKINRREENGV